jgi:hypothetical protein
MNPSRQKCTKIPVLLSAMVCPGAGQFVQKRWGAGITYLLCFLAAFIYVMLAAGKIIISYYRLGFEFDTYKPEPVSMLNLLLPFGLAVLIYLANIMDVFIAQQRIHSKQARDEFVRQNNLSN